MFKKVGNAQGKRKSLNAWNMWGIVLHTTAKIVHQITLLALLLACGRVFHSATKCQSRYIIPKKNARHGYILIIAIVDLSITLSSRNICRFESYLHHRTPRAWYGQGRPVSRCQPLPKRRWSLHLDGTSASCSSGRQRLFPTQKERSREAGIVFLAWLLNIVRYSQKLETHLKDLESRPEL